jgi:transglutaminase-like putative cysteine protease
VDGSLMQQTTWAAGSSTQIRVGYEFCYSFPQPTPMILTLSVHYSRASDLVRPDHILTSPSVPVTAYRDGFGNWCSRLVAPAGSVRISGDTVVNDSGARDPISPWAEQQPIETLPEEVLVFLLGSRYCETDRLSETAWQLFASSPTGWGRVQAICNFVHDRITFGYQYASPTKTAWQVFNEQQGVCRDYAHLAITLCRCMNIPARYCTGYLTDIGETPPFSAMDFAGWFEAFLGGKWHMFDPRNNVPRIGRVLIARGRDAADVALNTTFGPNTLESFRVWAHDVRDDS